MEALTKLWVTILECLIAIAPLIVVLAVVFVFVGVVLVVGIKLVEWLGKKYDDEPEHVMGLPKSYTKDDIVRCIRELRTLKGFPVPPRHPSLDDEEPRVALVIPGPSQLYIHEKQTKESADEADQEFEECCAEVANVVSGEAVMEYGEALDLVICYHFSWKQSQKQVKWLRERVKFLESELKEE